MRIALPQKWVDRLLKLPESGMGYQRVRVRLKDGRTIGPAIALNGHVLEIPDDIALLDSADIADIELVPTAAPR